VFTHTYAEPGDFTVTLTVTDPRGASDSVAAAVHVTDGSAPVVVITSGPEDPSGSAEASFTFTSSEAGTGFACSLDGGPAAGCGGGGASLLRDLMAHLSSAPATVSGSASVTGLNDGPHTFAVSVTDSAGNTGSASWSWEVDAASDLDHITLSPSVSTIEVGQSQAYAVTAFDESGGTMGDVTGSSTISGAGCSGSVCSPLVPGDFTITATFQGESAVATLTVMSPAPPEATFDHIVIQPGAATITYGGSQAYTALAVATDGSSMGDVTTDTRFAGAACAGSVCTPQAAGPHTVTGTYAGVLGVDSDTATLGVNKATLIVTAAAASREFGDANPAFTFTYSGFVLGDDEADLTAEPTCASSSVASDPAGAYPSAITCSGGADDSYGFTFVPGTLTITQAPVVVTPDDKSVAFGSADPVFTFGVTGLKNGETAAVFDAQPTCGVSGAHSDIGTYTITCSGGSDDDYSFAYGTATLTVDPATYSLRFVDQPVGGEAGRKFTATPKIVLKDADGLPVNSSGCTVVLDLGGNDEGAVLTGNVAPDTGVQYTFPQLRVDLPGDYTLHASVTGCGLAVTGETSAPFTITPAADIVGGSGASESVGSASTAGTFGRDRDGGSFSLLGPLLPLPHLVRSRRR
jgi:PKD repeat protein